MFDVLIFSIFSWSPLYKLCSIFYLELDNRGVDESNYSNEKKKLIILRIKVSW